MLNLPDVLQRQHIAGEMKFSLLLKQESTVPRINVDLAHFFVISQLLRQSHGKLRKDHALGVFFHEKLLLTESTLRSPKTSRNSTTGKIELRRLLHYWENRTQELIYFDEGDF